MKHLHALLAQTHDLDTRAAISWMLDVLDPSPSIHHVILAALPSDGAAWALALRDAALARFEVYALTREFRAFANAGAPEVLAHILRERRAALNRYRAAIERAARIRGGA